MTVKSIPSFTIENRPREVQGTTLAQSGVGTGIRTAS